MEEKIKGIVEKVLDMEINPATAGLHVTPTWDELRQLEIMMSIEDEFGVMFDREESLALSTYAKIVEKLKGELK